MVEHPSDLVEQAEPARFTGHLRAVVEPIWRAQHEHPFVRGIGTGTLSLDAFTFWIRQDYLFLIEYCRLFGLAAARAPDLVTIAKFADLLQVTARTEMDLHRGYAAQFGITLEQLEAEPMGPATRGYTDFLLRVAATGDFAELAAALLPCMWGFSEIGQRLVVQPGPADSRYAAWVEMYADPEFAQLADWCRSLVDRLAEDAGPAGRQRMVEAFVTSSRYELAFWEAAYTQQRWPDQ
jgi:thiaminase/transcriptional activator TenA